MRVNVFSDLEPYGEKNKPVSESIAVYCEAIEYYNVWKFLQGCFRSALELAPESMSVLLCLNMVLKGVVLPFFGHRDSRFGSWSDQEWTSLGYCCCLLPCCSALPGQLGEPRQGRSTGSWKGQEGGPMLLAATPAGSEWAGWGFHPWAALTRI